MALCLLHLLMRLPYGNGTDPVETLVYEENVAGPSPDRYFWSDAAFAPAACITTALAKYGWTAAIRNYEGGRAMEDLNVYKYCQANDETVVLCPTKVSTADRCEKELPGLGFIALIYRKSSDKAAFFSGQTVHKPPAYILDTANTNARISTRLPYLLNASRFARYVEADTWDKVGSLITADNVSKYLSSWISQYVLLSDGAGDDIKARYPLCEAHVDVSEDLGNPSAYECMILPRPHFQLEELTANVRLVMELLSPAV